MHRGWFVGNFNLTCFRNSSCEATCKHYYTAGEFESKHFHKIANEITLVVSTKLKGALRVFNITNYFVFDMFVPDAYLFIHNGFNVFARQS